MFWHKRPPTEIAQEFVDACNARDTVAMARILADDVVFEDSRGGRIEGRDEMLRALAAVNQVAPDLRVEINRASNLGDTALLAGRSLTSNHTLVCDTQWRAVVRDGKLVEWQAFGHPAESSLVGLITSLGRAE
ncbi:nuclear transport factor 2 family protein [Alteraurantiacibacter aquimixticola]|uniref:Nuclear transport factor 2 family protein n=1 Tax=Alteraurantiacibacter aquimixticola TaxID=2489173 RepID=A0A4T3F545_9SPHN|nr:nuclear transport factor 2 family protein [Alteraurantiacibacter aquimixticola]TIX51599.1 nuclear transport factor 2 family protein [Alteraurantiacibacter aquimixticola]